MSHHHKTTFKDVTNGMSDFGKALASPATSVIGSIKSAGGSFTLPLMIGGGVVVLFLFMKSK